MSEGIEEAGPSTLIDEELNEGIHEDPSPATIIDVEDHIEVEGQRHESPIRPIPNVSPIPEVRATVSHVHNPDPAETFRVWIIGPPVEVLLAHFKTQELFKDNVFEVPMILIQLGFGLLLGNFLAVILPRRVFRVWGTRLQFTLNPGPFNIKEHALIGVFAYIGLMRPNLLQSVSIDIAYFHNVIYWTMAFMATLASFLMCFPFVGLFTRHMVSAARMWWPTELVDVAFYRTWHDDIDRLLGNISNKFFFMIFFGLSFIYQTIVGFFFQSLSYLSPLCWVWKNSVVAQIIGAGKKGLGFLSFGMDWASLNTSMGDPLATPIVVILNLLFGYLITLVAILSLYWSNAFETRKFPMMSTEPYDAYGHPYNISRVLHNNGTFNEVGYRDYSNVHWTAFSIVTYSQLLGSLACGLVHVIMERELYTQIEEDVHNRLMERYDSVPKSWSITISVLALVLAVICSIARFGPEVNFPFSVVLAACLTALVAVIIVGPYFATTGEMLPISAGIVIIGGSLFPNERFNCMIYNNFTYQIATNTVQFLGFLKQAHYLQIPLKAMWKVLVVASIIVCSVSFHETWNQLNKHENPCVQQDLPTGSASINCPMLDMYYNRFNMWGVVGSRRIIGDSNYDAFIWSVVAVCIIAQVLLSYFGRRWVFLHSIKLPIILSAAGQIPFSGTATLNTWLSSGIVFYKVAYTRIPGWTPKWQYLLGTALAAGTAFASGMVLHFIRKFSPEWWGSIADDHCPLATCPTAPGIFIEGCIRH
ncbi:hypothetical protein Vadar_021166 [Vaccinium darrowii]|uniref:Uncharacterized protein n=1 Tax=Vaccinium darrowii TaxID=229202 RepID=A0ACB7YPN9_9ERIC|nr:hypothetical protein Vadar_021166 [Vaccinium darrowii]